MITRIRYVFTRKWFPGGPIAQVRAFWHHVVRRYEYELCGQCGRPVGVVWAASDLLWQRVTGQIEAVLCIHCFDDLATSKGWHVIWRARDGG